MNDDDIQTIWCDYYSRVRNRRVSEAEQLISTTRQGGITDQSEMFLDFTHFASAESDIIQLKQQLSENYEVSLSKDKESDYWFLHGTTRPFKMAFAHHQLIEWVKFMADVSQSYNCVFSKWVLTHERSGRQWTSESFEATTE